MDNMDLAKKGETAAENYLSDFGYRIIERNWHYRHKEIDIIAVDGNELVIVEVKTRQGHVLDNPAMAIDRKKRRNLIFAANAYARMNRISNEIRFDVMWVVYNGNQIDIDHIPDAFVPGL